MVRSNLSVVLIVVLACIGAFPSISGGASAPPGTNFRTFSPPQKANDIELTTTDGKPVSLSGMQGNTVLMGFWRNDCQYCGQEKKYLKQLTETLNRPDLKVLMVNLWDRPELVRDYAGGFGGKFLFAVGAPGRKSVFNNVVKGRLMGYYILNEAGEAVYEVKGFPSTYVIDKAGRVVAFHEGMAQWSSHGVVSWVKALLGPAREKAARLGQAVNSADASESRTDLMPPWFHRLMLGPDGPQITN